MNHNWLRVNMPFAHPEFVMQFVPVYVVIIEMKYYSGEIKGNKTVCMRGAA